MLGRGHSLTDPRGPVWVRIPYLLRRIFSQLMQSLGASDWHPQLAVSSADGSVTTTNMLRSTRKGGGMVCNLTLFLVHVLKTEQPFFTHKIFQMDYSRDTKEYRMLENFYPTVSECLHLIIAQGTDRCPRKSSIGQVRSRTPKLRALLPLLQREPQPGPHKWAYTK